MIPTYKSRSDPPRNPIASTSVMTRKAIALCLCLITFSGCASFSADDANKLPITAYGVRPTWSHALSAVRQRLARDLFGASSLKIYTEETLGFYRARYAPHLGVAPTYGWGMKFIIEARLPDFTDMEPTHYRALFRGKELIAVKNSEHYSIIELAEPIYPIAPRQ